MGRDALLATAVLIGLATPVHGQRAIEVGKPFADFVLPRIDNRQPVSLAQYQGRKVILIQFASW